MATARNKDRPAATEAPLSLRGVVDALSQALSAAALVVDRDGRLVAGSPTFQGQPVECGSIQDFPRGAGAAGLLKAVRRVLRTQATEQIEYQAELDGRRAWFAAAIAPLSEDTVIWLARDVSAMKRDEQDLTRWKERHLALVNSVDAILWEASADFTQGFTFISEQAERLLGYPAERWLSKPDFWAEHMHPEDRAWCVSFCLTKTAAGEDHDFEYRMIAADGRTVWLRDIVTVVIEDGKPAALRGVMIDITELKSAATEIADREQQYRSIFESTSDGLVINDLETGIILSANPAFCRMHGYDDMVGMHPTIHIHPDSHHLFAEYVETVRRGDQFRCRAQDVRRDGTLFDVEVVGRGLTYQGRQAVLGVVRDVTEQVRSEQALERRVADRTRELESLLNLARATSSTLDLNTLVRLILEDLRGVVEFKSAILVLSDEHEDWVVRDVIPPSGTPADEALRVRLREWPREASVFLNDEFGRLRRGEAVLVSDILGSLQGANESLRDQIADFGRSWMAVPLILKDELQGYIAMSSDEPAYFDDKQVLLARAFADQAAIAVENARLYEQAQRAAVVQERQRLARDLHDSVAQVLYGIALGARTARKYLDEDPSSSAEPIDYVVSLAAAGLAEMRTLIFDLHPESIEREGLVNALQRQVSVLEARHGLSVAWTPCPEPDVPLEVKEAVYAIVREAAHNIVKHAQATTVRIELRVTDGILGFEVEDDGIGFDPEMTAVGHLGLRSMRERAEKLGGELRIESVPGRRRTVVTGTVPGISRARA